MLKVDDDTLRSVRKVLGILRIINAYFHFMVAMTFSVGAIYCACLGHGFLAAEVIAFLLGWFAIATAEDGYERLLRGLLTLKQAEHPAPFVSANDNMKEDCGVGDIVKLLKR